MLSTNSGFSVPANNKGQEELYIIAPIDALNPQSTGHGSIVGVHDHVIPSPPAGNHGDYSAVWHVYLVVPGPNATGTNIATRFVNPPGLSLVYQADLGSGLVNLTSEERISEAESLGLVSLIDTGIVFVCPILH